MKRVWSRANNDNSGGTSSNAGADEQKVKVLNNRIYYYSEISDERILEFNKCIKNLENKSKIAAMNNGLDPLLSTRIYVHILSYGGYVCAGTAGMDTIREVRQSVPVTTIVEGAVASAATFLSVVGTERLMRKNAAMMIHQLNSDFWGKYSEIKDEVENLDMTMEMIRGIYKEYTSVPIKSLDAILKRDIWWDAKTCLKYGLIDKII